MKTKNIILLFSAAMVLISVTGCKKNDSGTSTEKQVAWVVGQADSAYSAGVILYTEDGGDTWARQGDLQMLKDIDILNIVSIDKDHLWAVGAMNTILKTEDGGKNWVKVTTSPAPAYSNMMSVSATDKNHVAVSGAPGIVLVTSDGGGSWRMADTNLFRSGIVQGVCAITSDIIYAVGQYATTTGTRGLVAMTRDGGNTWDTLVPPDDYNRYLWIGACATDTNHICIYGCVGHYMVTGDGYTTWMLGYLQSGDLNCMIMLDDHTYWAACDFDHILFSDNAGISWTQQPSAGISNQFLVGIDAWSDRIALITGQSAGAFPAGKILRTTDGGKTWNQIYTSNRNLFKVTFAKK